MAQLCVLCHKEMTAEERHPDEDSWVFGHKACIAELTDGNDVWVGGEVHWHWPQSPILDAEVA